MRSFRVLSVCFLFLFGFLGLRLVYEKDAVAQSFPDQLKRPIKESIHIRQETQKVEDEWAPEKEKLTAKYEVLLEKQQHQIALERHLKKDIDFYEKEIASLKKRNRKCSNNITRDRSLPEYGL